MSYVSLYLVSNHLVSCHCVVLLALESSCNSAPHWCTHPKNVLLAEVERLFCPHFSSVAPIHEIDVTLFLSVYTHTQRGQRVASFNKNKCDSLLDAMLLYNHSFVLGKIEVSEDPSWFWLWRLSHSDTWMEESRTTSPSTSWKTPSLSPRSLARATSALGTPPPTFTSWGSPTQASSSPSPTSTESQGHCSRPTRR